MAAVSSLSVISLRPLPWASHCRAAFHRANLGGRELPIPADLAADAVLACELADLSGANPERGGGGCGGVGHVISPGSVVNDYLTTGGNS